MRNLYSCLIISENVTDVSLFLFHRRLNGKATAAATPHGDGGLET